jgi:hypothetical protein
MDEPAHVEAPGEGQVLDRLSAGAAVSQRTRSVAAALTARHGVRTAEGDETAVSGAPLRTVVTAMTLSA